MARSRFPWARLLVGAVIVAACGSSDGATTEPSGTQAASSIGTSTSTAAADGSTTLADSSTSTAPTAAPSATAGTSPCEGDELPAVAAFDPAAGELRWSVCSAELLYREVVGVSEETVFVSASVEGNTELLAFDAEGGTQRWRRALAWPYPSWAKGAFAGSGVVVLPASEQPSQQLVGLDALTGEEVWRFGDPPPAPTTTTAGASTTTCQSLAAGSTTVSGAVPCFSGPVDASGGQPQLVPVAHTEGVVVASTPSGLRGIDRATGAALWSADQLSIGDESGDGGRIAVAVDDEQVFVPAGGGTVAIDAATGQELWRGPRLDDPWAADGSVVGASDDQQMISAIDAATGAARWTAPGRESYGDIIAIGDGAAYVLDREDGGVLAYDLSTGAERWRSGPVPGVEPQQVFEDMVLLLWNGELGAVSTQDGSARWALTSPLGSEWMSSLATNSTTIFVAVNSLPFAD